MLFVSRRTGYRHSDSAAREVNWGHLPDHFFEGSDINPSVDEYLLDQGPERSRTQGYPQPLNQLANPLLLTRSSFLCHHVPTSPHLDLGRAAEDTAPQ